MMILIESAIDEAAKREAQAIREEVFRREWGLTLPSVSNYQPEQCLTMLARCGASGKAVAALTVADTSNDQALHSRVSLDIPRGRTAARYTQLAVLKPYRGLDLPLHLILKAQQLFVEPRGIDVTWLLFDAERAKSLSFRKMLGYSLNPAKLWTEYGYSRLLVRDETSGAAKAANRRAKAYLEASNANDPEVNFGRMDSWHGSPALASLVSR